MICNDLPFQQPDTGDIGSVNGMLVPCLDEDPLSRFCF
jgi:hypothetical protein